MRKLLPLVLFAAIAVVYISCVATSTTWSNNAQDSISFMDTAKYFSGIAVTPTYAVIAHVGSWLPNDQWGMAFVGSTLPAIGACALVFLVVRRQTDNKWAPYVGAATLAASSIFLAHSTVIDFRTSVAFFIVAGYTALVYNRGRLGALSLGLAVGCHTTAALPAVVVFLLWSRRLRESWWVLLPAVVVPIALYTYTANVLWPTGITGSWTNALELWMGRSVAFVSYNIGPISAVLIASLGLSVVPVVAHLARIKESWPIVLILLTPAVYALTSSGLIGHVQFVAVMPLFAVAAGLGVSRLSPRAVPVILAASCIMLLMLPASWNNHTTSAQDFLSQLDEVEDNAVIVCQHYHEDYDGHKGAGMGTPLKIAVNYYNRESSRDLQTIQLSAYLSPDDEFGEKKTLNEKGLSTPLVVFDGRTMSSDDYVTLSIEEFMKANPNVPVYRVVLTHPETFECVLEKL